MAVSYTHLDVYKRQPDGLRAGHWFLSRAHLFYRPEIRLIKKTSRKDREERKEDAKELSLGVLCALGDLCVRSSFFHLPNLRIILHRAKRRVRRRASLSGATRVGAAGTGGSGAGVDVYKRQVRYFA